MLGVLAPLDEERQKAAVVVAQRERFPPERLAGRPLARAGAHRLEGDAGTPEPLHDGVHVVYVRSPADQPGRFDAMELPHIRAPRLLRVGRDDLEIPALSE